MSSKSLSEQREIPLTTACRLTGKRYAWLYPRLLSGEIEGRQQDGRWLVSLDAALRLQDQKAR